MTLRSDKAATDLSRVRMAYDAMSEVYAKKWCTDLVAKNELHYLRDLTRVGKSGVRTLVDIGCGPAVYFPIARELDLNYTGVDFSMAMLTCGRARFAGCQVVRADARRLPFADDTFGYAVAMNSLSHMDIPELTVSLREIARVLMAGGALFFSDQLGTVAHQIPYPLMPEYLIPVFPRSRETCESLLASAGFAIREVRVRAALVGEINHSKIMFWAAKNPM